MGGWETSGGITLKYQIQKKQILYNDGTRQVTRVKEKAYMEGINQVMEVGGREKRGINYNYYYCHSTHDPKVRRHSNG